MREWEAMSDSDKNHINYLMEKIGEKDEEIARMQKALEKVVKLESIGTCDTTGKIVVGYRGWVALEGLGEFDSEKYAVYKWQEELGDYAITEILEGEE